MTKDEKKENDMCFYVNTVKDKYFGVIKSQNANEVVIATPYIVEDGDRQRDIALKYIFEEYMNATPEIILNRTTIESIVQANEETEFVRLYRSTVPMAQKRALGKLTINELSALLE